MACTESQKCLVLFIIDTQQITRIVHYVRLQIKVRLNRPTAAIEFLLIELEVDTEQVARVLQ